MANLPHLLECERQNRRDEVAIDLEDRGTKKGTPPAAGETGDIRDLRRPRPGGCAGNMPARMDE